MQFPRHRSSHCFSPQSSITSSSDVIYIRRGLFTVQYKPGFGFPFYLHPVLKVFRAVTAKTIVGFGSKGIIGVPFQINERIGQIHLPQRLPADYHGSQRE